MRGTRVRVVDETGQDVPAGEIGEVAFANSALMSGYLDAPEGDPEVFRDGFFLTGDLGRLDAEGRLWITGRRKLFIDTVGYKIDPLEIEEVLLAHPAVAEAVVVGVKTGLGSELVKAVVVPNGEIAAEDLRAHCRGRLAEFKIPRLIDVVDRIPRSPLGKILRKDLISDSGGEGASRPAALRAALLGCRSTADRRLLLERYVCGEVAAMLLLADDEEVDPRRPLMYYGLSSVMAVDLSRRIEMALDVVLSAVLVWNQPTIAAIGDYLAAITSSAGPADAVPAAAPAIASSGRAADWLPATAEHGRAPSGDRTARRRRSTQPIVARSRWHGDLKMTSKGDAARL